MMAQLVNPALLAEREKLPIWSAKDALLREIHARETSIVVGEVRRALAHGAIPRVLTPRPRRPAAASRRRSRSLCAMTPVCATAVSASRSPDAWRPLASQHGETYTHAHVHVFETISLTEHVCVCVFACRLAQEMGVKLGAEVGYAVRFDELCR